MTSKKAYTRIPVPALIIFAIPHVPENTALDASTERQAKAIERSVPTARVVRLRGAHFIFLSNEADVLREMRAFFGQSEVVGWKIEVQDLPSGSAFRSTTRAMLPRPFDELLGS